MMNDLTTHLFGDIWSPNHGAWLEIRIEDAKRKFRDHMQSAAFLASNCVWDHAARTRVMARVYAQQWLALRRLRPGFDDRLSGAGDELRDRWFERFPGFKEQRDKDCADFLEGCRLAYNAANPDKAY